jgi:dTDP-glucose pyrophosphorylase
MWGIIPAAGNGSRIQPLACSKELLPIIGAVEGDREPPRAISELLIDRMRIAGVTKLCFIISPAKGDIIRYYGGSVAGMDVAYVVQPRPAGLCDALFRVCPFVNDGEPVVVGLPDTVWFPEDGLCALGDQALSFLLFPVDTPHAFDAVITDANDRVTEIHVKRADAGSNWIWGAFKMPGRVFHQLHDLWIGRDRRDEYVGTLVNAYLAAGGSAVGVRRGEVYVDVGTPNGFRRAIKLLASRRMVDEAAIGRRDEPLPLAPPGP